MAVGSCKVWLDPHLVNARVELWGYTWQTDSYYYVGNFIKPGWMGGEPSTEPYYLPGGPFPAMLTYTVRFPEQTLNGVTYLATEIGVDFTFQSDREYTISIEGSEVAEAYIYEIPYWVTGMPDWGTMWSDRTGPAPVPPPNYSDHPAQFGDAIYLSVGWFNTGSVAVTGHMVLKLTAPSGTVYDLSASSNQDRTMNPRSGATVLFNPFTLNEGGIWQVEAVLSQAGVRLDRETASFGIEQAVGIPTTLTINVPDKVASGAIFTVFGDLYETETMTRISNHRINLSYNGKSLGHVYTGIQGDYFIDVSINEGGTWTIKSSFAGTQTLQASRSQADAFVEASPLEAAIKITVPAVIGLGLITYSLR